MRWTAPLIAALACLLSIPAPASAQFGAPVQRPAVDRQGTLLFSPTIGVVHEGDADFAPVPEDNPRFTRGDEDVADVTDLALAARFRYSVLDDLSLGAQIGGLIGDFDAFVLGFGAKTQLVRQTSNMPVDVSIFTAIDLGLDDATALTWLLGPLAGSTIDLGAVDWTPYGGLGLGLTYLKPDGADEGDTEAAFGFVMGSDFAFSRDLSAFTEFDLGVTDGLPALNWQIGITYALVAPLARSSEPSY